MSISKKRSENLIYLFIWLIVGSLPVFTLRGEENLSWTRFVLEMIRILPFLFIFIINNSFLVQGLLFRKKVIQYLVYVSLAIVAIAILFDYSRYVQEFLLPDRPPHFNQFPNFDPPGNFDNPAPPGNHFLNIPHWGRVIDRIIISFLVVGFNTAVKLVFKRQEEDQNIEEQKKIHVQTELSFLKQQIGPHFFLNTLNNIHALIDISTEEAKEAIIKLSQLMGYMLYESQTEKIPVQKEMEFVRSYVELMKIRFTEDVDIELNIPDKLPSVSIPPLLTISFIENAFKHGISYEDPSYVHINFSFTDEKMFFEVKNPIHFKHLKSNNSGIGIINSRNRLDLIYDDKYELLIDQLNGKTYSVKLNIPL